MDQVFGQERPRFLAASETDMFEGMPHLVSIVNCLHII